MVDLTRVTKEKMVFVNGKETPIIEESLTAEEVLERAGFAPTEYALYFSNDSKEKPVKDDKKILKIENGMKLEAVLKKPRDQ
ncbi:hypothetical protein [Nitrososphaera viennensis]|uniref:Multi-ubiquitin domain-containing protein n=2 Tax=Nitrososphaera viennensis TaxID=1034015 RepID=A0A060HKQ6_9ARCH|nr:hypothetical protein [Nitrososphaera viennensis]AIC16063.1 hypothetical protein NVIE_018030 [Nitrososphaera viennensis EN76]UVS68032.1 hypothetical protein NWT39_08965 [Nitrososphaera viennensis]